MIKVNGYILAAVAFATAAWSGGVHAQTATGNMQVQITITEQCLVNAGSGGAGAGDTLLDFGSHGVLNANVDGQTSASGVGSIQVQCSSGTPYDIGLGAGLNPSTPGDVTTRRMINGANFVAYQLYQNAGRTTVWGDTIGTNTVSITADGTIQSRQVFGRVPPQTTTPFGTYVDTVVITVTY